MNHPNRSKTMQQKADAMLAAFGTLAEQYKADGKHGAAAEVLGASRQLDAASLARLHDLIRAA